MILGSTALLAQSGCLHGGKEEPAVPPVEYAGAGTYSAKQQTTVINGTIRFKNHSGEEILIEARHSIPCEQGRCPVIGEKPVGTLVLSQPGPFSMPLTHSAKDLMVIATCRSETGSTRIAHVYIEQEDAVIADVQLSLDRPYPPLR
jgi:hypothetical protein